MSHPGHHYRLNGYCPLCGGTLTHRVEVMNPPVSAARGTEAGNLNMAQHHRAFGLALEGALPARPAAAPPLCSDCPPIRYPTDKTRCDPCPRSQSNTGVRHD